LNDWTDGFMILFACPYFFLPDDRQRRFFSGGGPIAPIIFYLLWYLLSPWDSRLNC
jgi:hypothetical protein